MSIQTNVNQANGLIVLHVQGINGYLANAEVIYRAGSARGDYHEQTNTENSKKKMDSQETDSQSYPPSVIDLDNAPYPYHCMQMDKPPSNYTIKADIVS
jgi:hypothetical protein